MNQSTFDKAFNALQSHEGGYANVDGDAGGETYIGIARKYHPNWAGWPIIDAEKVRRGVSKLKHNEKLNNPTLLGLVRQYYKDVFWSKPQFGSVKNESIALMMFDAYMGQTGGFQWMLQKALKELGYKKYQNTPDTVQMLNYKPSIIADINAVSPSSVFFNKLKAIREDYFKYRASKPDQSKFLEGWLNRLNTYSFKDALTIADAEIKKKDSGTS